MHGWSAGERPAREGCAAITVDGWAQHLEILPARGKVARDARRATEGEDS